MELGRITFNKLKWMAEDANKAHGSDFFVVPSKLFKKRKYGICVKSDIFAHHVFIGTAKECYMFLLGFDIGAYYIKNYDFTQRNFINKKQESFFPETFIENTMMKIYEDDD